MAYGHRKKPLDFDGHPDHVRLGLGLGYSTCMNVYLFIYCLF